MEEIFECPVCDTEFVVGEDDDSVFCEVCLVRWVIPYY